MTHAKRVEMDEYWPTEAEQREYLAALPPEPRRSEADNDAYWDAVAESRADARAQDWRETW